MLQAYTSLPHNSLSINKSGISSTCPRAGIVELFAGAGGLAQGFLQSGHYELLALSDIDENAKSVFQANYPDSNYIACDVSDLTTQQILNATNGRRIVGLLGGPPCQGFSLAGQKNPNDARNAYVSEYLRFVSALSPDFLLMENVPQLLFHELFQTLLQILDVNYEVRYAILNTVLYGVPQTRHRAFVLAFHRRLGMKPSFPSPTHGFHNQALFNYYRKRMETSFDDETTHQEILGADPVIASLPTLIQIDHDRSQSFLPFVTVEDAIGDLQSLRNGQSFIQYPQEASTLYQRAARSLSNGQLFNHTARRHQASMIGLINLIPEGGDLQDVDQRYWPKSHYSQAYGRLHRHGFARTITTFFCNPGSGRFLHPTDARSITVREAARLQGFGDHFKFFGSQEQQMKLVGNAVPLPIAKAIATQIYEDIGSLLSG